MKRILAILIVVAFLLVPLRARAIDVERFNLDLGYNKDSMDNRNFFIRFDLTLDEPKTLKFIVDYEMYRSQTPEALNLLFDTDVQVNCLLAQSLAYIFVNSGYLQDTARGVEQVDVGGGVGMYFKFGSVQTGIFGRSSVTEQVDEMFSITSLDACVPLGDVLKLVEEAEYEVNIECHEDALLTADTSLVIALSDNIGLRAGLKYIYDNQPLLGHDDNYRWWYGGINISF